MGGYGVYVWPSYAVTFVLLALEVLMIIKRKRAISNRADPGASELETSELETGLSH